MAEFTRLQQVVSGGKLKYQLPDMILPVQKMPPEKAAWTAVNILNECVLAASTLLLPADATVTEAARRVYGQELDRSSAVMLAEKCFLENTVWKTPEQQTRENELHSELFAHFGTVPPPGTSGLAAVRQFPVSPMPDLTAKYFGRTPAALLRLGSLILAMPGEFARQLSVAPDTKIDGVWLETRRLAALSALHIIETHLVRAAAEYSAKSTPENLFAFRRWYYLREKTLSAVPLLRGSTNDTVILESILQLHRM